LINRKLEGARMIYVGIGALAVIAIFAVLWLKAERERRELERHSIEPQELFTIMNSKPGVMLFDVRQPLDVLAEAEIIPGAKRVPPKEIVEFSASVPKDQDLFIYCTCPSDKTSREMTRRALALNFIKVRFLRGGLAAWKEKGYPVLPYTETFRLDTAT
jgi:rhodanese-related sulfurtransferase